MSVYMFTSSLQLEAERKTKVGGTSNPAANLSLDHSSVRETIRARLESSLNFRGVFRQEQVSNGDITWGGTT